VVEALKTTVRAFAIQVKYLLNSRQRLNTKCYACHAALLTKQTSAEMKTKETVAPNSLEKQLEKILCLVIA
jgi:hypothetical protein